MDIRVDDTETTPEIVFVNAAVKVKKPVSQPFLDEYLDWEVRYR